MKARIHDQPARAERQRLQVAEAADLIAFVGAELVGELLRIQRPALGVRVEGQELPDERHLVRVLALPDVTRNGFVKGQVGEAVFAVQARRAEVDPVAARNLAID